MPEFKQQRRCLEEQECLVLSQPRELEKQIKTRLRENAAKFSKQTIHRDGLMKECQLSGRESLQVRFCCTFTGGPEKGRSAGFALPADFRRFSISYLPPLAAPVAFTSALL